MKADENGSKEPYFAALEPKNEGPRASSRPFSDSFMKLSENPQARAKRLAIRRLIATKMNASPVSHSLS